MKTLLLLWDYKLKISCVFIFSVLGLLCAAIGYQLAEIRTSVLRSSVPLEIIEKLQRAQIGDYLVMETGEVLRVDGPRIENGRLHFDIRATSGGYYGAKPLSHVAKTVVGVVASTDMNYGALNQCFYGSRVVTTVGPAKWTCT